MDLQINLLLIIVIILAVFKMVKGYKQGMIKEIISLTSLLVMCAVAVLIVAGLHSYMDKQIVGVVTAVLLLVLIGIVQHLLEVVFFSAKAISKLPIISWIDKLLGMVFGIFEIVILLWTVYTLISYFELGMIEEMIMEYTYQSEVLMNIYQYNLLAPVISEIMAELK